MKICSSCNKEKDITEFNFRNKDKSVRHSYCAECGKIKMRKHYLSNKDSYLAKAKKHTESNIDYIRKQKERPCYDCGIQYPYYVMDFDHLEDKSFNISERMRNTGINVLKAEVLKCQVVCANCHRERTQNNLLV